MTTTKTRSDEVALAERWQAKGLTTGQVEDLLGIARDLANVTGKPIGSCLDDVDQRVVAVLEDRLLGRATDTILYGTDLGK